MRFDADRLHAALTGVRAKPTPADVTRASVAVLLRLTEEPAVLLMKRAEFDGDPWSGHVSLPGGRAEPTDPDSVATAVRETHEELGIDLRMAAYVAPLPSFPATAHGRTSTLWVEPHVFVEGEPATPRPNIEVAAWRWLPLGAAARGELDGTLRVRDMHLPCWNFEDFCVWGMTYGLLQNMLATLRRYSPAT